MERQASRHQDRHISRKRYIQVSKYLHRQTGRWRDILSSNLPDIKTSRGKSKTSRHQDVWKDIQTDRYQYNHPDTHPNRQRDNKKSRQTDIKSTHPGRRTDRELGFQTDIHQDKKHPDRKTFRMTVIHYKFSRDYWDFG